MKKILFVAMISSSMSIVQASGYWESFKTWTSECIGCAKRETASVASKGLVLGAQAAVAYYLPGKIESTAQKIRETALETMQNMFFGTGDFVNVGGRDLMVRQGTSSNSFLNLALKATGLPRALEYPIVCADKALGLSAAIEEKIGNPQTYLKKLVEEKISQFLLSVGQDNRPKSSNKSEIISDENPKNNRFLTNETYGNLKDKLSLRSKSEIEDGVKTWEVKDYADYIKYQLHKKANSLFQESVEAVLGNLGNESLSLMSTLVPAVAGSFGMLVAGPAGFLAGTAAGLHYNSSVQDAIKENAINPLVKSYINATSTWFTEEEVTKFELVFDASEDDEDGLTTLQKESLDPFCFKAEQIAVNAKKAACETTEKVVNVVAQKTEEATKGAIATFFAPATKMLSWLNLTSPKKNSLEELARLEGVGLTIHNAD